MQHITEIMGAVFTALNTIQTTTGKVYPIIANEGTQFPFIVFERQTVSPTVTKDGVCCNDIQVAVKVVTAGYYEGLQVAESVYTAMWSIDSENVTYADVQLLNATEEYTNDAYVQTLYYTFKVFYQESNNSVIVIPDPSTGGNTPDPSTGTDPTPTLTEYTITDDSFSSNNNVVGITLSDNGALQGLAASDIVIYTNSGATVTLQSIDNGFHAIWIKRATSANANFTITILAHNGYAETTKTLQWNYIQIDNEE